MTWPILIVVIADILLIVAEIRRKRRTDRARMQRAMLAGVIKRTVQ